jgi:endonuclease/exonuclease/phosphatase family metal-dependent hydrolase
MRIVSYNILDGGEGRADPLAEVILAQRPDVVALVEADDAAVVDRIARRAKMDFIHATGGKKGAALLSRFPIRQTIDHAASIEQPKLKSLLEATIVDPAGGELIFGVVHLTAKATEDAEATRMEEIAAVLQTFASHRANHRAHLLLGDFNSNHPDQHVDPARCKEATRQAWQQNGGQIPRRVVQTILDNGYLDTLHAVDPRRANGEGSFDTQHPGQRVDYIFAFGIERPRIGGAWIEKDRLAKYASDHFPIGAEINFSR